MKPDFSLPFNTYDFFGYLLPGTLFSLGLVGIFNQQVLNILKNNHIQNLQPYFAIILALIVCAGLYFVGQIIGCIGHIIYDRLIVRNILGYPFYTILNWKHEMNEIFPWFSHIVILTSLFLILFPLFIYTSIIPICFWIIFSLVLFLNREKLKKYNQDNKKEIAKACLNKLSKTFCKLTATDCKVNDSLKKLFEKKLDDRLQLKEDDFQEYNSDIYWITYIDLMKKKNTCHERKISNWLDMYGCLRNYSCVFLLLAVIESLHLWKNVFDYGSGSLDGRNLFVLVFTLFFSLILFMRYWIMYYSYYSKYIIRAYALEDFNSNENN
jgi:hypothetical protein